MSLRAISIVALLWSGCSHRSIPIGVADDVGPLPPAASLDNVRVSVRGSTAIVEFEPVVGAGDYRIYPEPDPADVQIGTDGSFVVRNAIYRCAGDRPYAEREVGNSLSGDAWGYERIEADSILGYVYLTAAPDRQPVYQVSWPHGAVFNNVPSHHDLNLNDYVVGAATRDEYLSHGARDEGIAFYVSNAGTRAIHRFRYMRDPSLPWIHLTLYYPDGPERIARENVDASQIDPFGNGEHFRVLTEPGDDGRVALHRVFHELAGNPEYYDGLAAGEERFERMLHQGNRPLPSVTWPGLIGPTRLVVEALDVGCPFPNGYLAPTHVDASDQDTYASITLDEARLPTTEVYVNGQHDPVNRPRPIARAYVQAAPEAPPSFDYFQGFDPGDPWTVPTIDVGGNGTFSFRNDVLIADFGGCSTNTTLGPLLGQLSIGFGDYGSTCAVSLLPRGVSPSLSSDRYLHVRMTSDVTSTIRRFPHVILTTMPPVGLSLTEGANPNYLHWDMGVTASEGVGGPMKDHVAIVVQTRDVQSALDVQFCDHRDWSAAGPCPVAGIYGPDPYQGMDSTPWLPIPVVGDLLGHDRPVRLDIYASTERIYVLLDDEPYGCATFPAGRVPAGPIHVAFGALLFHHAAEDIVSAANSPMQYLHRYSTSHSHRGLDDLGIHIGTEAPPWNDARFPCVTTWYPR